MESIGGLNASITAPGVLEKNGAHPHVRPTQGSDCHCVDCRAGECCSVCDLLERSRRGDRGPEGREWMVSK